MKNRIKIAVATPKIKLCNPTYNVNECIDYAKRADSARADVILFPELAISGATAGDLYFQDRLIDACEAALSAYIDATESLSIMSFIGLPLRIDAQTYNAVVCVSEGEIIGITLSGLATRQFSAAPANGMRASVAGRSVEMARDFIYTDDDTGAHIFVKIGDDNAFSSDGVNLILNPTAMVEYVGLAAERRLYAEKVSSMLEVGFVISGAGYGESGTDGIYAAPKLVAQNGNIIAEAPLFDHGILYADVDLKAKNKKEPCENNLEEKILRYPFVPESENERSDACELALDIQARSLALRMERAYSKCAVIGVSGGLDSTLAVLVAAKAMDILGYSRDKIIAITMPCFGTTERTKGNALALASALGCTVRTIDIKAAVNQHFLDISHDAGKYDVVYENAQARERTQILMDVANAEGGLVIGTGDLSELALGFATYNGDHMSMYCVNGSVPKTFMRAIIAHVAEKEAKANSERISSVLLDVINTPVSPELLPVDNGENKQHTESIVGPYELHDFFLYYTVKYGYTPNRIFELAKSAFSEYGADEIRGYLNIFIRRFFSQQFKRSCLPDGPRVTEISLSPRGAWQMPSDVSGALWAEDISQ